MNNKLLIGLALILTVILAVLGAYLSIISNRLDTLQTSLDHYADETVMHYRTVEYYLHNTLTPIE